MILSELQIGDEFVHANCKKSKPDVFLVIGKPVFNPRHGSPTRKCRNNKGQAVSKSCRLAVLRIGQHTQKTGMEKSINTPIQLTF